MRVWGYIGLFSLAAIIVILGLGWYLFNQPMDPNSSIGRGFADGFQKEFKASCLEQAPAMDEATKVKFTAYCGCAADAFYEEYKNAPPAKLFGLETDEAEQATMQRITTTCIQQSGLQ
jgi:hypothetical protein